ncbi:MAG: hypothetical protein LBM09_01460 [Candidatus Nomurabacteria bacterium]|jgi:hypothetical protein|nr:hypothetical protein [Candidatus Nomurabacteria bacterium]
MTYAKIIFMYQFSWMWFFIGLAVVAGGILFVRFYKQIADNFGSGAASYERYKLVGLIIAIFGILMMFNLHNLIFKFIANLIFGGVMNKG